MKGGGGGGFAVNRSSFVRSDDRWGLLYQMVQQQKILLSWLLGRMRH